MAPEQTSWRIAPLGDSAVLVTWLGDDTSAVAMVQQLHSRLAMHHIPGLVELVPGVASLLCCIDPLVAGWDGLAGVVRTHLPSAAQAQPEAGNIVEIEVVYGGGVGPDLGDVASACGLEEVEVVALHTAQPMPVLIVGFMPGFPYIGRLPDRLRLPRRREPRSVVAAGSVGIANDQTGIYPSRSPGGWHIIGRTQHSLFDPRRQPPALLKAGDWVRFLAVEER